MKSLKIVEPKAFTKAKEEYAARYAPSSTPLLFCIYFVMFSALTIFIGGIEKIERALFISIISSLIFVYPLQWLLSLMPSSIVIGQGGVAIGRTVVRPTDIQYAIIGRVKYDSMEYPALIFVTKQNVEYVYGLPSNIYLSDVAAIFKDMGVEVKP